MGSEAKMRTDWTRADYKEQLDNGFFDYSVYEDKITGNKFAVVEKGSTFTRHNKAGWKKTKTVMFPLDDEYKTEKKRYKRKAAVYLAITILFIIAVFSCFIVDAVILENPVRAIIVSAVILVAYRVIQHNRIVDYRIWKKFDELFLKVKMNRSSEKPYSSATLVLLPIPEDVYSHAYVAFPGIKVQGKDSKIWKGKVASRIVEFMKSNGTFGSLAQVSYESRKIQQLKDVLREEAKAYNNLNNDGNKNNANKVSQSIVIDAKNKIEEINARILEIQGMYIKWANDFYESEVDKNNAEFMNLVAEADSAIRRNETADSNER